MPALVRALWAKAATWNRPIFKAPPLEVEPPMADVASLVEELPKLGRSER